MDRGWVETGSLPGARRGELESLFELFLRHQEPLRRYFRRLTGRQPAWRGQTDDLLHEALLTLARSLERRKECPGRAASILEGQFEAYFRRIVRNLVVDLERALKRHRTFTAGAMTRGSQSNGLLELPSREPSQATRMEASEDLDRLQTELFELPAADREVLMLWMRGEPYEEIARLRHTTPGAACSQKKRALARLRARLSRSSHPRSG